MSRIIIHDTFKQALTKLNKELLSEFGIQDIMAVPNSKILELMHHIFGRIISRERFMSENEQTFMGSTIVAIKAIDDQFIWHGNIIFRRQGLVALILAKTQQEEKLFEPGNIVRGLSVNDLRRRKIEIGLSQSITRKYYEVVGYSGGSGSIHMRVKDVYGNTYNYPQRAFTLTKETDLEELYKKSLEKNFRAEVEDAKKHKVEALDATYQNSLREYLEASRLLFEANADDVDKLVDARVKGTMDFGKKFINFPQIRSARITGDGEVELVTKHMFNEPAKHNKRYPIGRYKVNISKRNGFYAKIVNLDTQTTTHSQHMHVNREGGVCWGGWISPLRKAYDRLDYMSLVVGIIDFLEHYNDGSPYDSRSTFMSKWKSRFEDDYKFEQYEDKLIAKTKEKEEENKTIKDVVIKKKRRTRAEMVIFRANEAVRKDKIAKEIADKKAAKAATIIAVDEAREVTDTPVRWTPVQARERAQVIARRELEEAAAGHSQGESEEIRVAFAGAMENFRVNSLSVRTPREVIIDDTLGGLTPF